MKATTIHLKYVLLSLMLLNLLQWKYWICQLQNMYSMLPTIQDDAIIMFKISPYGIP